MKLGYIACWTSFELKSLEGKVYCKGLSGPSSENLEKVSFLSKLITVGALRIRNVQAEREVS